MNISDYRAKAAHKSARRHLILSVVCGVLAIGWAVITVACSLAAADGVGGTYVASGALYGIASVIEFAAAFLFLRASRLHEAEAYTWEQTAKLEAKRDEWVKVR